MTTHFNGGTPVNDAGTLQVVTSGGAYSSGGLLYDAADNLVVANGGVIAGYATGGMPVNAAGALCVAYGGIPVSFVAGIPLDAAGRVCITAPVVLNFVEEMSVAHELTVGQNPAGTRVGYRKNEWGDWQPDDVPSLQRLFTNLGNDRLVVQATGDKSALVISNIHIVRFAPFQEFDFGPPNSVVYDGVQTDFTWIVPGFDFVLGENYEVSLS